MRGSEIKTRDEMREIRDEVNTIRDMLPKVFSLYSSHRYLSLILLKMMDKSKESQTQSLAELQQELKSLKALLLSRGPALSSSPSASPIPALGRPSIPAWQLAGANDTPASPTPTPSLPPLPPVSNGKGKEVDRSA